MSLALALPTAVLAELVDPPLALAAGPQAVAEGPPDAEAPGEPGQTYWAEAGVMEPKVPKRRANRQQGEAGPRGRQATNVAAAENHVGPQKYRWRLVSRRRGG